MTIEQKEQQILTLIYQLPLIRRIRLAWTIIQGVQADQIHIEESSLPIPPFSPMTDDEWIKELNHRVREIESGSLKAIPGEDVMAKARKIAP